MDEQAVRFVERDLQGFAAVDVITLFSGAGDPDNFAFLRRVLANDVIGRVGDDDVVVEIDAQMLGSIERRLDRVAAVAGNSRFACAGNGANLAISVDDAQRVTAAFEDVNVAFAIDAGGTRIDQWAGLCVGAVFRSVFLAVARDVDELVGFHVDVVNAALVEVGQIELAEIAGEGDAVDAAELHVLRWTFAGEWFLAGADARERFDRAGLGIDLADAIVPRVGGVEDAVRRDGKAVHAVEGRLERRAAVAGVALGAGAGEQRQHAFGIDFEDAPAGQFDEVVVAG